MNPEGEWGDLYNLVNDALQSRENQQQPDRARQPRRDLAWLVWKDPNGVYTHADREAEGMEPMSLEGAREKMREIVTRDEV